MIPDLWVNILSWRVILQIFSNLACDRLISDPRAASSPYHGRAYHDRRVACTRGRTLGYLTLRVRLSDVGMSYIVIT